MYYVRTRAVTGRDSDLLTASLTVTRVTDSELHFTILGAITRFTYNAGRSLGSHPSCYIEGDLYMLCS